MHLVGERVGKGVFLLQQASFGIATHIVWRFVVRNVDIVTPARPRRRSCSIVCFFIRGLVIAVV